MLSGAVVKNLPAAVGDSRDLGSIPGLGRSPRGGNSNQLQYSCLKNSMGRGAWQDSWLMDCKESDMIEFTKLVRLLFAKTASQIFLFLPAVRYLVSKMCLTLCDPMDCSLPAFYVHGILQARTLE